MDTTPVKELYRHLCTVPGVTWGASTVELPETAPAALRREVHKWQQWLIACHRLHMLITKPALLDDEADEAELLARRLNYPIRRLRFRFNEPEAGWQELTQ